MINSYNITNVFHTCHRNIRHIQFLCYERISSGSSGSSSSSILVSSCSKLRLKDSHTGPSTPRTPAQGDTDTQTPERCNEQLTYIYQLYDQNVLLFSYCTRLICVYVQLNFICKVSIGNWNFRVPSQRFPVPTWNFKIVQIGRITRKLRFFFLFT